MGMSIDNCYCSGVFLQTRKENENFKVYNIGGKCSYFSGISFMLCIGINLKISVVEPSTGEVSPAKPMRAEQGWTVGELKQCIGEVRLKLVMLSRASFYFFFSLFRYLISIRHV